MDKVMDENIEQQPINKPKKKVSAVNIFVNRYMGAGFWLVAFIGANLFWGFYTLQLVSSLKAEEKIAVLTADGTLMITAGKTYDRSAELQRLCARHATLSLLSRNPKGLDHETMFKAYFLAGAQKQVLKDLERERKVFKEKSIHQKVEIKSTDIQPGKDGVLYALTEGQLIMNGRFGDTSFVYPEKYRLTLTLVKNPDVGANGYAPYSVLTYTLKTEKSEVTENLNKKIDIKKEEGGQ